MSERKQRKKLHMLGRFTYHHYKVTLQTTEDETEYYVKIWKGNFHHDRIRSPEPEEVQTYNDLRIARREYENAVSAAIHNTTYTDVSIFMQQQATSTL